MPEPLAVKNCIAGLKSILGDSALLSPSTRAIIENTVGHLENYKKMQENKFKSKIKTVRFMKGDEVLVVWNLEDSALEQLMNRDAIDFQVTL